MGITDYVSALTDLNHETGALFPGLARMAARVAATAAAMIECDGGTSGTFGMGEASADLWTLTSERNSEAVARGEPLIIPDLLADGRLARHRLAIAGIRFLAILALPVLEDETPGWIAVLDPEPRTGLSDEQLVALRDVAALTAAACVQERRQVALAEMTKRAVRADRMLRLVSEAGTFESALSSLLGELCRHHGAPVGRIWKLILPEGSMVEVSRFLEHEYYSLPPEAPVRSGNSMTAAAIASNEPQTVIYSHVEQPDQFVLMEAAMKSGLASQVSYPIWVQEQRFGISLAFATEREDLDSIVADIASLAHTIRPALFRKVTEERIRYMAHHDDLTQLGNRAVFNECLSEAVDTATRGDHGLALLYLDLDGFKRVNDVRGHEVGDKLLAAVAGRLRAGVREGDTVARIGGDEFAVIQPCNGQPYAALQLAQRLVQMLGVPFEIDGQPSTIGVSIGIALHPADGETPDALLRNADAALYSAKASGRNTCRLFDASLGSVQEEKFLIERDIRDAIENERFSLVYQPICDCQTLQVCGLEALLRWDHPTKGMIPPSRFVPIAEASGLILPLGRWALERACADAAAWDKPVCLSVNFSPMQFRQPGLPAEIGAVLARTGLSPARLDLEVTEGLLLDDSGVVLETMHELRAQGIRITLDDFGTAYASLSYLRRFPFDQLKIDMSFVQGMCDDDATLAIVETVLALGERLRLDVVAEGVEEEQELETLRRLGCARVQGYLTGRPMSNERARRMLAEETRIRVERLG